MAVNYSSKETNDIHALENYTSSIIAAVAAGNFTGILAYIDSVVNTAVNAAVATVSVEGNYTNWTKQWNKTVATNWNSNEAVAFGVTSISVNTTTNEILLLCDDSLLYAVVSLTNGTINGTIAAMVSGGTGQHSFPVSALGKYAAIVVDTGSTYNILVYKNTVLTETIDFCTETGYSYIAGRVFLVAMSGDGQYIVVSGPDWYSPSMSIKVLLLKGS